MGAEDMGRVLADFIKGLYWIVGSLAVVVIVLIAVIIYLLVK